MASREEVRVDCVADFSPQLEGSGLSPPRISIEVGSAMDGVGRGLNNSTFSIMILGPKSLGAPS